MFARTERLMLRPGWAEDAPALARAIGDEAIVRNLADVPWPYRREDADAFLCRRDGAGALADFLIFLRTRGSPKLIGGIGLRRSAEEGTELGYWIARPCWGLGFATEAARAVVALAHASLRLPRITAGHYLDNPASGRVLRKLGFVPTGRIVQRRSLGRGRAAPWAVFSRGVSDAMPDCPAEALAA